MSWREYSPGMPFTDNLDVMHIFNHKEKKKYVITSILSNAALRM